MMAAALSIMSSFIFLMVSICPWTSIDLFFLSSEYDLRVAFACSLTLMIFAFSNSFSSEYFCSSSSQQTFDNFIKYISVLCWIFLVSLSIIFRFKDVRDHEIGIEEGELIGLDSFDFSF